MRFAITSIGRQGIKSKANLDKATKVCNFVRACRSGRFYYPFLWSNRDIHLGLTLYADWEPMSPYIRELKAKQEVTTNSLKKIEAGQSA